MLRLLSLAFQFEGRSLVRSRVGTVALVAYLSIGALSLFLGDRYVAGWNKPSRMLRKPSKNLSMKHVTTWLRAKDRRAAHGSTCRCRWQDYYAGTRVYREPSISRASPRVRWTRRWRSVNRRSIPLRVEATGLKSRVGHGRCGSHFRQPSCRRC